MTPHKPSPYRFLPKSSGPQPSQRPAPLQTPSRPTAVGNQGSSSTASKFRFPSTPRFAAPSSARTQSQSERIEDVGPSSPLLPSDGTRMSIDGFRENAFAGEDVDFDVPQYRESPSSPDEFDDLIAIYERRHGRRSRTPAATDTDDLVANTSLSHARKKRKFQDERNSDIIFVSSSPSSTGSPELTTPPQERYITQPAAEARLNEGEESLLSIKPALRHFHPEGSNRPPDAAFRMSKPAFIRPTSSASIPDHHRNGGPNLLPDAFSPSKRRGRGRDYVSRGMADTMVNFVLAIGHQDTGQGQQQQNQLQRTTRIGNVEYNRIMHVAALREEENGRGVIIRGHDGALYLLVGSPANELVKGGRRSIEVGSRIGLRKGHLSWEIGRDLQVDGADKEPGVTIVQFTVSVMWDIDPPWT